MSLPPTWPWNHGLEISLNNPPEISPNLPILSLLHSFWMLRSSKVTFNSIMLCDRSKERQNQTLPNSPKSTIGEELLNMHPLDPKLDPGPISPLPTLPSHHLEHLCLATESPSWPWMWHLVVLLRIGLSLPPSWRKPQKQNRSQLCSKGNVFTLLPFHWALWHRTQAMRHLWGLPAVPMQQAQLRASSDLVCYCFSFSGHWCFKAASSCKGMYLQRDFTDVPFKAPSS